MKNEKFIKVIHKNKHILFKCKIIRRLKYMSKDVELVKKDAYFLIQWKEEMRKMAG